MVEYKIVPEGLCDFVVEITSPKSFRSVAGFPTKAAAMAWVVEQQASDGGAIQEPC